MSNRRSFAKSTIAELSRNLQYVIPYEKYSFLSPSQIAEMGLSAKSSSPSRISYSEANACLSLFIHDASKDKLVSGLSLQLGRKLDENDLKFCKDFMRVFNSDIANAPDKFRDSELWTSLQQTRFARAIGRFSPFTTDNFTRWLQVIQNASTLQYEGNPFSACVLMTKQSKWVEHSSAMKFLRFPNRLPFENAILREKWIRALLRDPLIGLVGLSVAGAIVGAVIFEGGSNVGSAFAPHESLIPVSSAIVPGTMAFVSSSHGDLYVLFPSGATFVKSQGRWRLFNYQAFTELLESLPPKDVAFSLRRIVLDLSFERRGGLVVILPDEKNISKLVPDHGNSEKANRALRNFAKKLEVTNSSHRRVLSSGTAIDGAIVLSKDGRVLDIACMIGEPTKADCLAVDKSALQRFPGARSTAAWNASVYGISIKVSSDGPITIFQHGNVIFEMG